MNAIVAASTLGELSGWTLSNLQIQKLLYLAQMFHMGENEGEPIFQDDFEAWKLGPVIPSVYQQAKIYGSKPVKSFFTKTRLPEGSAKDVIARTLAELPDHSPWKLVSITHWDGGAWAKYFEDGDRGTTIPKGDILAEYRDRAEAHAARAKTG